MDTNQINTPQFYPKYLNQYEINKPLLVISDFYSVDWLPGHLENLQEWRKHVIEDGCYVNDKEGPATLLFTHQLNARLVEALYLLSQTKQAVKLAKRIHIHFDEQLLQEEKEWVHYPLYLSRAECINPYMAIHHCFEVYTINEYRGFLYEWLETGLSNYAADETLEAGDIIYFYENMQKLYEAAWIIRQREIEPVLKKDFDDKEYSTETLGSESSTFPFIQRNCRFNERLTPEETAGLYKLVKIIIAEVASVQLISCLGTHPNPAAYYLLVITDEKDKTPEHELVNKIEDNCRQLINVHALVHKSDAFIRTLGEGNRFFSHALSAGNVCYQMPGISLPEPVVPAHQPLKLMMEACWKRWGYQGKAFLDTALQRFEGGDLNLTAFLLHQATESTLSAIIRVNLDYRLVNHNLSKMLKLTLMFTDDFQNLFDLTRPDEIEAFALLQSAYSAARYKDDFIADKEIAKDLADKVVQLYHMAEGMYDKLIAEVED
ncbi:MAG: HEPN domain-containing protein [Mucilaginibacter sp.]